MRQPKPELVTLLLFGLAGCSMEPKLNPSTQPQPAFYVSLASASARIDAASARDLLNAYRQRIGLGPVEISPDLMIFAQKQANAMAAAAATDATRATPLLQRLAGVGIVRRAAMENASAGYHTVSDAFSGWRGSPRHDAAFRMAGGRKMGIATAYNTASRHKIYWTFVITD